MTPREKMVHAAFWVILTLGFYYLRLFHMEPLVYGDGGMALFMLGGLIGNAGLFYLGVLWVVPRFHRFGFQWSSLGWGGLMVVASTGLKLAYLGFLFRVFAPGQSNSEVLTLMAYVYLAENAGFILSGAAFFMIRHIGWYERNRLELERDKLEAELGFLKMQVNPHFLFNTLNNLYGLAVRESAESTADGLLKLGAMMRYILHDSNQDRVPLHLEIDFIRHYIDLQALRYSQKRGIQVGFEVEGGAEGSLVPPLLLMVPVENAFKHALKGGGPAQIQINMWVGLETVRFKVRNSKQPESGLKEDPGGIGLENLQRRLELLYPNQAALKIENHSDYFDAVLCLPRK